MEFEITKQTQYFNTHLQAFQILTCKVAQAFKFNTDTATQHIFELPGALKDSKSCLMYIIKPFLRLFSVFSI